MPGVTSFGRSVAAKMWEINSKEAKHVPIILGSVGASVVGGLFVYKLTIKDLSTYCKASTFLPITLSLQSLCRCQSCVRIESANTALTTAAASQPASLCRPPYAG